MNEAQLQEKLRQVFDRFDEDGSGFVSTEELTRMMTTLKVERTPAQIRKMMIDADPDGSGEISFEEFSTVLKKQLKDGDMDGIASVVMAGGGAFGWLNPLSWFQSEEAPAEQSTGGRPPASPSYGSPGSLSSSKYYAKTPESVRSSLDFTPTHRMKATQGQVQALNREVADTVKVAKSEGKRRQEAMRQRFLNRQQQKIEVTHMQKGDVVEAVEFLKDQKRFEGWQNKQKIIHAWEAEKVKKEKFAKKANKRVSEFRKNKAREREERNANELLKDQGVAASGLADRMQRKEQALETKRAETAQAKGRAAQVKYETRPEVRQEGRDMFQEQRDAIAAAEKEKREEDMRKIQSRKSDYLKKQAAMKAKVDDMHQVAREARETLEETRKQQAAMLRSHLDAHRRRKEEIMENHRQGTKEKHDGIYAWHKSGMMDPAEVYY